MFDVTPLWWRQMYIFQQTRICYSMLHKKRYRPPFKVIPHEEKLFSIFEPHTEWIRKGKAGVPQELGLKVCIVEDRYQFIMHHQVMVQKTDEQVAVTMIDECIERFGPIGSASFDKGFHSRAKQQNLAERVDQ